MLWANAFVGAAINLHMLLMKARNVAMYYEVSARYHVTSVNCTRYSVRDSG